MNDPQNKIILDEKNIYSRDNVAVFAVLKFNSNTKRGLVVCSTHILFNQNRGDIKLGQITQILRMMKKLHKMFGMKNLIIFKCEIFRAS